MARGKRPVRKVVLAERTFCQIAGKNISDENCQLTQGQEGCFGCASPHRVCEACHDRLVDVPAVGMCSMCLILALNAEIEHKPAPVPAQTKVTCQLFGREIQAAMCLASQGQEGCKNCAAQTRLCEQCKKHPVRIVRYGMCLKCSVDAYGDGWDPKNVVFPKYEPPQRVVKTVTIPRTDPDRGKGRVYSLPEATQGHPVAISAPGNGSHSTHPMRGPKTRADTGESASTDQTSGTTPEKHDPLFEKAKKLVIEHQRVSEDFLGDNLHISLTRSKRLLRALEKAGVISPVPGPRRPRQVLLPFDDGRKSVAVDAEPVNWEQARGLLPKARKLICKHNQTSSKFLARHLHVKLATALNVLKLLEQEGFVGPKQGGSLPREILAAKSQSRRITPAGPLARKLAPEIRQEILRSGDATERHLKEVFQASFETIRQVLTLLEEEGVIGPARAGLRREILIKAGSTPPPTKLRSPRSLKKVEKLIQIVGRNSELGQTLQSLMEEVVQLRQRMELFRSLTKHK